MQHEALLRYSRQILLPQIDIEGQQKILEASAAVFGLGGLGSPVAMYLAAAGVGRLVLIDFDVVEMSNLQRQIIHQTDDLKRPKVDSARDCLRALNPGVTIETVA
ncbi:MAG TPA: ThiF family adenylyltransferase, partial [Gammaproteobacteria bacterium]|nr:ThiF family adenylyltransferase [Gammaproteobacteria bacterium]